MGCYREILFMGIQESGSFDPDRIAQLAAQLRAQAQLKKLKDYVSSLQNSGAENGDTTSAPASAASDEIRETYISPTYYPQKDIPVILNPNIDAHTTSPTSDNFGNPEYRIPEENRPSFERRNPDYMSTSPQSEASTGPRVVFSSWEILMDPSAETPVHISDSLLDRPKKLGLVSALSAPQFGEPAAAQDQEVGGLDVNPRRQTKDINYKNSQPLKELDPNIIFRYQGPKDLEK
jgi:hypothetical protein